MQASSASGEALRLATFTAAGTPFELMDATVRGARCRVFRHAPRCLSQLYVAAQAHAARTFTVADGVRLSYAQVLAHAAALAADLAAHGVGRGTHVALAMRNRPEWLVAFIASSALGAVPVLVNSRGTAPEIAASLRYAACEHVLADGPRAQLIAAGGAAGLAGVLVGGGQLPGRTWRRYEDIVAGPAGALPAVECAPEDPAVIMFTSGTTGVPRGAVLSHVGMLTALMANQLSVAVLAAQIAAHLGIDMAALARGAPQPCTLLVFPLFHTGGCLSVFLANLARGGKLAFLPRWQAAAALQLIQEERVTSLPAVPTMLWDLLQSPQLAQFDTSSLANLGTGGQGMPANLLQVIHATFPRAILGTGYGMTETNGMVSLTMGEEYLAYPDSAGRPLPTAQIRIVDEAGREVRAGDSGEVCIRSAQNMNGYWDSPGGGCRAGARRLAVQRRRRPHRWPGVSVHRRAQDRHGHLRRRKHLLRRSRARAAAASAGAGSGDLRCTRWAARRAAGRGDRAARGGKARCRSAARVLRHAARRLQAAARLALRRAPRAQCPRQGHQGAVARASVRRMTTCRCPRM